MVAVVLKHGNQEIANHLHGFINRSFNLMKKLQSYRVRATQIPVKDSKEHIKFHNELNALGKDLTHLSRTLVNGLSIAKRADCMKPCAFAQSFLSEDERRNAYVSRLDTIHAEAIASTENQTVRELSFNLRICMQVLYDVVFWSDAPPMHVVRFQGLMLDFVKVDQFLDNFSAYQAISKNIFDAAAAQKALKAPGKAKRRRSAQDSEQGSQVANGPQSLLESGWGGLGVELNAAMEQLNKRKREERRKQEQAELQDRRNLMIQNCYESGALQVGNDEDGHATDAEDQNPWDQTLWACHHMPISV